MLNLLLATLAAVSLTACLDEASSPPDTVTAGSQHAIDTLATDVQPTTTDRAVEPADDTACTLAPLAGTDPDSACAHLCDPDFAATYIPEHICVTFACKLADGREYVTGGCSF